MSLTNSHGLKRKLANRHIQMIAIGGVIGTGLFLSSGKTLSGAGPIGAVICYSVVGLFVLCVVSSLGEMASLMPIAGSYNTYASRMVDQALGFTLGWNYWLIWTISVPMEVLAASKVTQFWIPGSVMPSWAWNSVFLLILFMLNCLNVRGYAETEFFLSIVKIVAILAFIVFGFVMAFVTGIKFTNVVGPSAEPFGDNALSFCSVFITSFFAFGGVEIIGVTAAEAENPSVVVPKAIYGTMFRLAVFNILSIFVVGLLVPSTDPRLLLTGDEATSPFTIALENTGVNFAASIINAVILIAVLSAGNSSVYASPRILMGLANEGHAPAIFARTTVSGIPFIGMCVTLIISAAILAVGSLKGGVVLGVLMNITALSTIFTWLGILVTHLRFRQAYIAQGYNLADLPYVAPFYPYAQTFTLVVIICAVVVVGIVQSISGEPIVTVLAQYLGVPVYILLFVGYKVIKKTRLVPVESVDFEALKESSSCNSSEFGDIENMVEDDETLEPSEQSRLSGGFHNQKLPNGDAI